MKTVTLSRRESVMALVIVVLATLSVALVVVVATFPRTSKARHLRHRQRPVQTPTCLSPGCVRTAGRTLTTLDTSVDPCEDFYSYACGGVLTDTQLTSDGGVVHSAHATTDRNMIQVLKLPAVELSGKESKAIGKVKQFYASCTNVTRNHGKHTADLQQYIDSLGGWTLTGGGGGNLTSVRLEKTAASVHTGGGLFVLTVDTQTTNSSQYQLSFRRSRPLLADIGEHNDSDVKQTYVTYMAGVTRLLGGHSEINTTKARLDEIFAIDMDILKITPLQDVRGHPASTFHSMTLRNVQALLGPRFRLERYLREATNASFLGRDVVLVESESYVAGVGAILEKYSVGAIRDYLVWRAICPKLRYLSKPFADLHRQYSGQPAQSTAKACLALTTSLFNQAIGALYAEHYHRTSIGKEVLNMIQHLRKAFKETVRHVSWMDDVTKRNAADKVDTMSAGIAFTDVLRNPEKLDERYALYDPVRRDDFFWNVVAAERGQNKHTLNLRGSTPTVATEILDRAAASDSSATYWARENALIVWPRRLQYALYDQHFTTAMKYGSLGFRLGRQVISAVANGGKDMDGTINYKKLWSPSAATNLDELIQCFLDQYASSEMTSAPALSAAETMTDIGGIKLAYNAHWYWLNSNGLTGGTGNETLLPGIALTPSQLFFVGMATPLCMVRTEQQYFEAKNRVMVSLGNYHKFSETFKCSSGSRMNPRKQCVVW